MTTSKSIFQSVLGSAQGHVPQRTVLEPMTALTEELADEFGPAKIYGRTATSKLLQGQDPVQDASGR